jgi:hypothetical protein
LTHDRSLRREDTPLVAPRSWKAVQGLDISQWLRWLVGAEAAVLASTKF